MTIHSQRFATEVLLRLAEVLPDVEIILEYGVKPYRVDAYLPLHNIVIEIDENEHKSYSQESEFKRSAYITEQLRCGWIRVSDFMSVDSTVDHLLKQLAYYGISSTSTSKVSLEEDDNKDTKKTYRQQLKELKESLLEEKARVELEDLERQLKFQTDSDEYFRSVSKLIEDNFYITSNKKDFIEFSEFKTKMDKLLATEDEDGVKLYQGINFESVLTYLQKKYSITKKRTNRGSDGAYRNLYALIGITVK